MIKEEDIKVGNFVVMDEEVSVDTGGVLLYKHTPSRQDISLQEWERCGWCYISGSPSPTIFKIISVDGDVEIEPTQKILYLDSEKANALCIPTEMFKENFSLYRGNEEQVEHPSHYAWLKELCGIEPLDICRHLGFNVGNAIKYLLRKDKVDGNKTKREKRIEDLKKAKFYIEDEIKLLEHEKENV